jgi:hypothetical protein
VKRARKYFWLGLLLAIPFVVLPQGGIVTDHVALTDRGHVEGLTYSNATLGFTYQLPQGFFVNPLPDNLPHESLLLMIADKHNGTPWRDRVTLVADDTRKYSWNISEYVTHFIGSTPKIHVVVRRHAYRFDIAGQDFVRADLQKLDGGKTIYEVFVCTRLKGSFVSWMFGSLDEKRVEQMAKSINTFALANAKTR